jgi:hypothetical protein
MWLQILLYLKPFYDQYNLFNTMGTGSFPGIQRSERGFDHPPPFSVKVKEKVRAIPLLPFWAFAASCRVNFTVSFTFTFSCSL